MKLTNKELLLIIQGRLACLEARLEGTSSECLEAIVTAFETEPPMLRLVSYRKGDKIKVIKMLREHLGLNLGDAKRMSEDLPSRIDLPMMHGLNAFAKALRDQGAEVELV